MRKSTIERRIRENDRMIRLLENRVEGLTNRLAKLEQVIVILDRSVDP